jgi:hypothetical protein
MKSRTTLLLFLASITVSGCGPSLKDDIAYFERVLGKKLPPQAKNIQVTNDQSWGSYDLQSTMTFHFEGNPRAFFREWNLPMPPKKGPAVIVDLPNDVTLTNYRIRTEEPETETHVTILFDLDTNMCYITIMELK